MATDAIISLEQLHCATLRGVSEESQPEPYIWPALIRIDDNTLHTSDRVALTAPSVAQARIVIKDSMRAGETAPIPGSVGILRTRYEESVAMVWLLLVVALFDLDETPKSAAQAGFRTFVSELRAAIVENLLLLADGSDPQGRQRAVDGIKKRVEERTTAAVVNAMSGTDKVKVALGILNPDDPFGSDFKGFGTEIIKGKVVLQPTNFTLNFEKRTVITFRGRPEESLAKFDIQGRLQLRPVRVDPCQLLAKAVNDAQATVDGLQDEIRHLADEPGNSKDFIREEAERITEEELKPALAELQAAHSALAICRRRESVSVDPPDTVLGRV
jgi:hypothetical protein